VRSCTPTMKNDFANDLKTVSTALGPSSVAITATASRRFRWGSDLHAPITVALFGDVRRGELCALRWQDVDLATDCIHVGQMLEETRSEKTRGKYRETILTFKEPKSKKSRRTIPLGPNAMAALKWHRAQQNALRLKTGGYEGDLVFCNADGSSCKPDTLTKQFASAVRRIAIQRIRLHDLRHSHATQLLRAGVHFKVVSERLGHASVMITLDLYSHVLPGMGAEAVDRTNGPLRQTGRA
jgi:integrase